MRLIGLRRCLRPWAKSLTSAFFLTMVFSATWAWPQPEGKTRSTRPKGAGRKASGAQLPANTKGDLPVFSGIHPHLAVTNGGGSECGIGAVVPWAGKLWYITYPAHQPKGSDDRLYELDANLNPAVRPESVGGTHANRMIHRESNQLIIGPYFIDAKGNVRGVKPSDMPGRLTAVVRHLTDPANHVYFFTMEEGLYEVDVNTLKVKMLHKDRNVGGTELLPGDHGKGAYTGQGRLIVANNGRGGALAEWNGTGDPGDPKAWTIVDRNKYTDVTGPGGLYGSPDKDSPVWALGWDRKSVLLNVLDQGRWSRFRLPKASFTYDADHGWFTEWPRIRDIGADRLLMTMHGMFYEFPKTFRVAGAAGIRPIATYHKMVVDFADWNGRLVLACDDASMFENPLLGRPQSNLWFSALDDLRELGKPIGWGGPWVGNRVRANEPSEPYLLAGFERRVVHLSHDKTSAVTFTFEIDSKGDGIWSKYASVVVPARGYAYHVIPSDVKGEWIRVKTDSAVSSATAYFHYFSSPKAADEAMFKSLPPADRPAARSEGVIRPQSDAELTLQFAADILDASGKIVEQGYYEIGGDMRLHRADNPIADGELRKKLATKQDFDVDEASVIMTEKGKRYRLPKGPDMFSNPSASGWPRGLREVVTERNLANIHGTIYEIPRAASGGLSRIKPVCTHNRLIHDFASWRGMLVLSGNLADAPADAHYVPSEDGRAGLWFGKVDDLWKLGHPRGEGGPWRETSVQANVPSDPYLMAGYDRKAVKLSHDQKRAVQFTIAVDFLGDGTSHVYNTIAVPAGQTITYSFPEGFSAHWVRVKSDTDCKATVWFTYDNAPE